VEERKGRSRRRKKKKQNRDFFIVNESIAPSTGIFF
jgi:hypothetical protein